MYYDQRPALDSLVAQLFGDWGWWGSRSNPYLLVFDAVGIKPLQAMNRAGVVTEKVRFNFEPDRVHWATCAGRDFTHRQAVSAMRRVGANATGPCRRRSAWGWRRSREVP